MSRAISKKKAEEFSGVSKPDPAPKSRKGKKNKPPVKRKYMTPEEMLIHFQAYRVKTKTDPFLVNTFVGKDGNEVDLEKEKPLLMEGFHCYLFEEGICTDCSHIFSNRDGRYAAYVPVCDYIRTVIRQDQIGGGMAGVYNSNLTARLQGLVDKAETKNTNTNFELEFDLS